MNRKICPNDYCLKLQVALSDAITVSCGTDCSIYTSHDKFLFLAYLRAVILLICCF